MKVKVSIKLLLIKDNLLEYLDIFSIMLQ